MIMHMLTAEQRTVLFGHPHVCLFSFFLTSNFDYSTALIQNVVLLDDWLSLDSQLFGN